MMRKQYRLHEAIKKVETFGLKPSCHSEANPESFVYITQEFTPKGEEYAVFRKSYSKYSGQSIGSAWRPK